MTRLPLIPLLCLAACAGGDDAVTVQPTDPPPCDYPEGAQAEMAIDAVLTPYFWPEAIHADGRTTAMAMTDAFCDSDDTIAWGQSRAILFVSIPAW